jgi:hypothetical protein
VQRDVFISFRLLSGLNESVMKGNRKKRKEESGEIQY